MAFFLGALARVCLMATFWNFVLFQAGWFAYVIGVGNQQVFWAVLVTLTYIAIHIWRSDSLTSELKPLIKIVLFIVSTYTLTSNLDLVSFQDAWLSTYLSPVWMWALFASTLNESLSSLRGRPILGAVLGGISGLMSYGAGIRMVAGA